MALRYSSIQKGTISLAAGDTSGTATITSVDTTKAVVLCSVRVDALDANQQLCTWQLTNATTVTVTRNTSGAAMVVEYTVVEFGAGASVQRGSVTIADAATSNTASLSAVATGRTWIVHSQRYTGTGQVGSSTLAREALTNATTITFTRGASTSDLVIEWQAVEFATDADGTVQRGEVTVSSTTSLTDVTLGTAVTLARAFPWVAMSTGTAGPQPNNLLVQASLTSTTNLRVQRSGTSNTNVHSWQVVELASDWTVTPVAVQFANGDGDDDDTISAVVVADSFCLIPTLGRYGMCGNSGNDMSVGTLTQTLTTTTNVNSLRGEPTGVMDVQSVVISGVQGVAGPTITDQPANATVLLSEGSSASFTVAATGTGTLTYQWNRNATPISGATSATLNVTGIVIGDDGDTFDCDVTDDNGTTASATATLTVLVGDALSAAGGTTDGSGEAATQYTTDASAAAGTVSRVQAVSGGVTKTLAMRPGG